LDVLERLVLTARKGQFLFLCGAGKLLSQAVRTALVPLEGLLPASKIKPTLLGTQLPLNRSKAAPGYSDGVRVLVPADGVVRFSALAVLERPQ